MDLTEFVEALITTELRKNLIILFQSLRQNSQRQYFVLNLGQTLIFRYELALTQYYTGWRTIHLVVTDTFI